MNEPNYTEDNMDELREYYLGEIDKKDAEIEQLRAERLHMWTIYDHPRDRPDVFIARLWIVDAYGPIAMSETREAPTLEALRDMLPFGLTRLPRTPLDDPNIVEVWL